MKAIKHIALFTSLFAGSTMLVNAQITPILKPRTHLISDSSSAVSTQDSSKKATKAERNAMKAADVKKLLDSKTFTFHARYANPLGGGVTSLNGQLINISPQGTGHIYLTTDYDVRVRPDSVIAFLPYFGRTTFAPSLNSDDAGVKFTSTKFEYDAKKGKRGNTVIIINPSDAKYNRKMILDVNENGTATLQMIITNRNSISYDGYIESK
jgi:hypothetical protein